MKNIIGHKIIRLEETDSTNKQALSGDYSTGTVIIAKRQIKGKGRKNRTWYSYNGGIYMSILFNNVKDYTFFYRFAILTALGVKEELEKLAGGGFYIKWPNDVYYGDKKICGILLQSTTQGEKNRIVVGIGINLNNSVKNFPEEVKLRSTSIVDITGNMTDIEKTINDILDILNIYYSALKRKEFSSYLEKVNGSLYKKGKVVEFLIGMNTTKLRILEIGMDGKLSVEDERKNRLKLDFGEVL